MIVCQGMLAVLRPHPTTSHVGISALQICLQTLPASWPLRHGKHICRALQQSSLRPEPGLGGPSGARPFIEKRQEGLGQSALATTAPPESLAVSTCEPGGQGPSSGLRSSSNVPKQARQEAEAQACRAALGRELQRGNLREALRLANAVWAAGVALGPQQSDVLLQGRHPPFLLPWVCRVAPFHWTFGWFIGLFLCVQPPTCWLVNLRAALCCRKVITSCSSNRW